jgi:hypothetical protein
MTTAEESKRLTQYWQEQISVWEQSGQTQKSFCEQHDLVYHRFGYWRRKFQEKAKPVDWVHRPSGFVSVQQMPGRATTGLMLTLPNGVSIQGIEPGNLPLVTQLLRQL